MAGKKKSCLKPIHIPADKIPSSFSFLTFFRSIILLSFKKRRVVGEKTQPDEAVYFRIQIPPNALLPTCTRPTTSTSTPCFVFTYPPIGLTTIEALYHLKSRLPRSADRLHPRWSNATSPSRSSSSSSFFFLQLLDLLFGR